MENALATSMVEAGVRARGDCLALATPDAPFVVEEIQRRIGSERADMLVLEAGSDLTLLAELREARPSLPIVAVIVAQPEVAFQAARLGAAGILTLPLQENDVAAKLESAVGAIQSTADTGPHDDAAVAGPFAERAPADFPNSFSTSPRMAEIRDTIEKVATTSATVLIRGESGVGKEIVARMIFARSERSHKPFVKVNCAAIPNDLLESELFGFEAGAFTGAQRAKPGKFEMADTGTMFLDEIAEMHPMLQAKLLHVLQDGEFSRLGSKRDTSVDVRVICATNKLLEQRVAQGLFREDLLYRINVVTIQIPPLRERREEIPALIDYFIAKYSSMYKRSVPPLDGQAMPFLLSYSWPGNIRELENLCKRYVIVGGAAQIIREMAARNGGADSQQEASAGTVSGSAEIEPKKAALSLLEIGRRAAWEAERGAIEKMLEETHWNRKEAARRLRVSYKALLNKIEQMMRERPQA